MPINASPESIAYSEAPESHTAYIDMGAAASSGRSTLTEKEFYTSLLPSYFIPDVDLNSINFDAANEAWKRIIESRAQRYTDLKSAPETQEEFETKSCLMWFYDHFYELSYLHDESSRSLYKGNIKIQSKALVGMIGMILNQFKVKNAETLTKSLHAVAKGHCIKRGVRAYQYPIVGEVLLKTFSTCLDEKEWDDETSLAWRQMFSLVLQITLPAAIKEETLLSSEQQEEAATQLKTHMESTKGGVVLDSTEEKLERSEHARESDKETSEKIIAADSSPIITVLSPRQVTNDAL